MNHIPVRNCAACRTGKPKSELVRLVRTSDGKVSYDPTGKVDGRGLYWCGEVSCLNKLKKKGLISRLLKADVPDKVYLQLEEVIKERI